MATRRGAMLAPNRDPGARSITFRLPQELYETLSSIAENERRSMNGVTAILLEEALAARKGATDAQKAEIAALKKSLREAKAAAKKAGTTT